jgi:transcription antitermination factor NusG
MKDKNVWKVVYVASRHEKKAALRLEQLGIDHFLPLYRKLRQWSDRKQWVEVPLFNSYLFVKPTDLQRDKVLEVPGVVAYLRYNNEDAMVQDKELKTIQTILTSGYSLESINAPEQFQLGEQVLITDGPLIGHTGDILRQNDKEHFLVSFDTLGQSIKIELPYQVFEKIK